MFCSALFRASGCSSKFHPKKAPVRQPCSISTYFLQSHKHRLADLGPEHGPPRVRLNKGTYVFQNGQWRREDHPCSCRQPKQPEKKLRAKNKALCEENNYLKLELELVMDMLTETTARLQTLERKLRKKSCQKPKEAKEPEGCIVVSPKCT